MLDRVADLLEMRDANPFRTRSYRRAASEVRQLEKPLAQAYKARGKAALSDIEGVGHKLAGSIAEIIETERLGLLDRLTAEVSPADLLAQLPGIGQKLAERIHDELGVESLEALEQAAHDGRLASMQGIGEKKLEGIRDALAGRLGRSARRRAHRRAERDEPESTEQPIDLLLELDAQYRRKAEAGKLRQIAPKRFNPDNETWLPIMHASRKGWDFTLLYSNTKRAHELDRTRDWVVIYYDRDHEEGQRTVVTAGSGKLKGKRVVRGRERECREHYAGD
jgi:DNA polymerase (family 10)